MSWIDGFTCSRLSVPSIQTRTKKIKLQMWGFGKFPLNNFCVFVLCESAQCLHHHLIQSYIQKQIKLKNSTFSVGMVTVGLAFIENNWMSFELWFSTKFYHLELFLHFDIKIVGYWGSWESKPNINIYTIYTFACIHIAVNNSNVTELNTSTFYTFSWLIKF